METRIEQADGARSIIIQDLAKDGETVLRQATQFYSATGQTRSEYVDVDGDHMGVIAWIRSRKECSFRDHWAISGY